jgi:hypothetical protein
MVIQRWNYFNVLWKDSKSRKSVYRHPKLHRILPKIFKHYLS